MIAERVSGLDRRGDVSGDTGATIETAPSWGKAGRFVVPSLGRDKAAEVGGFVIRAAV